MILIEHEMRLVAMDDEMTQALVWDREDEDWIETKDFAAKAYLEGEILSEKRAAKLFPNADLDSLPDWEE